MDSDANENTDPPEPISITGIIKEKLISILLLIGAIIVDWLKTKALE